MANIVYRGSAAPTVANTAANKGAALTNDEIDKNFFALNDASITIGTTPIKLSASSTSLSGLTSIAVTDLTVGGNLIVNGTTTTINSSTLTTDDKNIELGVAIALSNISGTITTSALTSAVTVTSTSGLIPGMLLTKVSGTGVFGPIATITSIDSATQITVTASTSNTLGAIVFNAGGVTDATANGGGITLKGATDKTIIWDSTNANWTSSENWNIPIGKVFKINNVSMLSSTILGSTVTSSSLTKLGTVAGFVKSDASGNLSADTNTYLTSAGDGALTISVVSAATTNNTVTLALSGAYSANTSTARTLDLKVGPALTNLATLMTTAGAGFIKRGATADTYTIDTSTYLTSYTEADTLATVTTRGASTTTAISINNATPSTTTGSGALIVTGGVGIGGDISVGANITSSSDIRIKTNIEKIANALEKVEQLNGYTFDRTDTQIARQTGVIAQEVLKVLPEAVTGSEETTYSVAYGNMMGLMIEAMKELNAKVVDLQNKLA